MVVQSIPREKKCIRKPLGGRARLEECCPPDKSTAPTAHQQTDRPGHEPAAAARVATAAVLRVRHSACHQGRQVTDISHGPKLKAFGFGLGLASQLLEGQ